MYGNKRHVGQLYSVRTTIHKIDELVKTGIPLVTINMGIQDIWLTNDTVMVHLNPEEIDISEVTTQTAYDNGYDSEPEQKEDSKREPPLSSFITSPADIETHRKVKIKYKEIDQKYRKQFEELCERYKDIFSLIY